MIYHRENQTAWFSLSSDHNQVDRYWHTKIHWGVDDVDDDDIRALVVISWGEQLLGARYCQLYYITGEEGPPHTAVRSSSEQTDLWVERLWEIEWEREVVLPRTHNNRHTVRPDRALFQIVLTHLQSSSSIHTTRTPLWNRRTTFLFSSLFLSLHQSRSSEQLIFFKNSCMLLLWIIFTLFLRPRWVEDACEIIIIFNSK